MAKEYGLLKYEQLANKESTIFQEHKTNITKLVEREQPKTPEESIDAR